MSLFDNIAAAFVRRILRVMISDAETSDIINKELLRLVNEDEAFKRALSSFSITRDFKSTNSGHSSNS